MTEGEIRQATQRALSAWSAPENVGEFDPETQKMVPGSFRSLDDLLIKELLPPT